MTRRLLGLVSLIVMGATTLTPPAHSAGAALYQHGHSNAQQPQAGSSLTYNQFLSQQLKRLTPAQRKKAIRDFAEDGVFINTPELWEVDDAQVIWAAIQRAQEPYQPVMLSALERVFLALPTDWRRIEAAGILYRYNKPVGKEYLKTRLAQDHNTEAAAIFAINQDPTMLSGIVEAMTSSDDDSAIIAALATWDNSEVAIGLVQAFRKDPENVNYSLALARHNIKESLPLTQRLYKITLDDDAAHLDATAALLKLGDSQKAKLIAYLRDVLLGRRAKAGLQLEAIQALGEIQDPDGVALLREVINAYLLRQNKTAMSQDAAALDVLAVTAAEALSKNNNAPADIKRLLTDLLERLAANKAASELLQEAGRAVMRLGDSEHVVEKTMGKQWLQRQSLINALKLLTPELTPVDHAPNFVPVDLK